MARRFFRKIHLWLGIVCSPAVLVVCVTGCLLAFEDEIRTLSEPYSFVEARTGAFLPPTQLITTAQKHLPDNGQPWRIRIDYRGESLSTIVMAFNNKGIYNVYLDPYTGNVLKVKNQNRDFFRIVKTGHRSLWLGYPGRIIVGSCVFVFIFVLITGIFVWWPSKVSLSKMKKRLTFKIHRGKRLFFDLHNVLGIYSFLFVIILSFTGVVVSFNWVSHSIYFALSGNAYPASKAVYSDTIQAIAGDSALDKLPVLIYNEYQDRNLSLSILPPFSPDAPIWVIINPKAKNTLEQMESRYHREFRYFDQYTLQELKTGELENEPISKANAGGKFLRMNYDLHTGRIGSLPTKLIACIASLLAASLPVSGFLIWRQKRRKTRKGDR